MTNVFEDDWRSLLDSKYSESEYDFLRNNGGNSVQNISNTLNLNKALESISLSFSNNYDGGNATISAQDIANNTQSKSAFYDAIRFPPIPKVNLPEELLADRFVLDRHLQSNHNNSHGHSRSDSSNNAVGDNSVNSANNVSGKRNYSINSSDSIAGLDFLEAMLVTIVEKAVDIRNNIIEHGLYLYSISRPCSLETINYCTNTILNNLILLRDESLQLIKDMSLFHNDKVNNMIHANINSGKDIINDRKASLLQRSSLLRNEITESAIVIDNLVHYLNSVTNYPTIPICKLDGIYINWKQNKKIQAKITSSRKSYFYKKFMVKNNLPVNNSVYKYLQSMKKCYYILSITNYEFVENELSHTFEFFHRLDLFVKRSSNSAAERGDVSNSNNSKNYNYTVDNIEETKTLAASAYDKTKVLIVDNCGINDKDCHLISNHLKRFINLHTLSLRENAITNSGVSSLATALWDNITFIRCIKLDSNAITTDGVISLSESIPNVHRLEILSLANNKIEDLGLYYLLKSTMNKHRRAYLTLPKPLKGNFLSSLGYDQHDFLDEEDLFEDELDDEQDTENKDSDALNGEKIVIGKNSVYTNYFLSYAIEKKKVMKLEKKKLNVQMYDYSDSDEEEGGEKWYNNTEDEFYMDTRSEYSDDENGADYPDADQGNAESKKEFEGNFDIANGEQQYSKFHVYMNYKGPMIVKLLIKHRLKLAAISAFLRVLRKGHILSSLNIANCNLTHVSVRMLHHALLDNPNITMLDISNNEEILKDNGTCVLLAELIEHGGLRTLKLNNTGLTDEGVHIITKAAMKSVSLSSLELSGNNVGPTGANWIANANKSYYTDEITFTSGFHLSAPFKKTDDSVVHDWESRAESEQSEASRVSAQYKKHRSRMSYHSNKYARNFEMDSLWDEETEAEIEVEEELVAGDEENEEAEGEIEGSDTGKTNEVDSVESLHRRKGFFSSKKKDKGKQDDGYDSESSTNLAKRIDIL